MAVRIVIDSSSDILPDDAKRLGLYHIPLLVTIGDTEYKDGVDISHQEFYEKLIESDNLPTTSQISPATYEQVFEELTAGGDTVLVITLSSALSGTYQSACIAASEYEGRVYVVDSLSATLGERILIERAVELRDSGMPAGEMAEILDKEKKEIKILAALDTLEYLKKGGRISAAVAFAGGILSIKPVVSVVDGKVEMVGKARGSKNSENLLRSLIVKSGGVDFSRPLCLGYSGLDDTTLRKYIEDSGDLWKGITGELPITTVGAAIGTHVGPGAIAVAFFANKEA